MCGASRRSLDRSRARSSSSLACCRARHRCARLAWSSTMSEPVAVRVPQMNPNDEQAVIVRWHVAKGERVRAGQTLVTLETTKTTFDVDSPNDGYAFFEHEPNAELAVGAPFAWIAENDGPLQIATPATAVDAQPASRPKERFTRKARKLIKE